MNGSSIYRVWDPESERVPTSHNCFVEEGISAYENMANIGVNSKGETSSTVDPVASSSEVTGPDPRVPLLSRYSSISGGVSTPATPARRPSLLQRFQGLHDVNPNDLRSLNTPQLSMPSTESRDSTPSVRYPVIAGHLPSSPTPFNVAADYPTLNFESSPLSTPPQDPQLPGSFDDSSAHVSYAYAAISSSDVVEPSTYKQAVESPLCDKWKQAMKEEICSLEENNTWDVVPVPSGQHILQGRWVYKVKRDAHGQVSRYKARWVVKGYKQQFGIDYDQTFASVVKPQTYKTLFALVAHYNLEADQMDVTTAFLYGPIDQIVYVELPHGYGLPGMVALLNKALYGLKQAPRLWYKTLHDHLTSLGFRRLDSDHSVFFQVNDGVIIAVYVDDLLIGDDKPAIQDVKVRLADVFKMSDLGPVSYYLSMTLPLYSHNLSDSSLMNLSADSPVAIFERCARYPSDGALALKLPVYFAVLCSIIGVGLGSHLLCCMR